LQRRCGGAQMIARNAQLALNALLPALLRRLRCWRIEPRPRHQRPLAAHRLQRVRGVRELRPGRLYIDQTRLAVQACFGVANCRARVGERRVLPQSLASVRQLIQQVATLRLLRAWNASN